MADLQTVLAGLRGTSMGANDPLQLAALRDQRLSEQQDRERAAKAAAAGIIPRPNSPVEQKIDPMASDYRTQIQENNFGDIARALGEGGQLASDMVQDPYTGAAAHGAEADTEQKFKQAQLAGFQDPQAQAAYGQQMDLRKLLMPVSVEEAKTGGQLAVGQQRFDQNQQMLDRLEGPPAGPGSGGALRGPGSRTAFSINPEGGMTVTGSQASPQLTAQERRAEAAVDTNKGLSDRVMALYEQALPDIGQNPQKYASMMDAIPQQLGGRLFYSKLGATVPGGANLGQNDSEIRQLVGAIQAQAVSAMNTGRLSGPVIEFVKQHLPDVNYSPGENYQRIKVLRDVIGPAIQNGIGQANGLAGLLGVQ
jgi:hypothetical protein